MSTMTKKRATQLTKEIRDGLSLTAAKLAEFIEGEGWKPLKYNSFTAWWNDNLTDITLAVELRAAVVYEMFREGSDPTKVAESIKGIGPETAENLQTQRDNGVPADKARASRRRRSTPRGTLFLNIGVNDYAEFTAITERFDTTPEAVFLEAGYRAMDELKREM